MRIIMDVPDLGKPETTVMKSGALLLRLNKRKGITVSSKQQGGIA
jgi:hypothetical protein